MRVFTFSRRVESGKPDSPGRPGLESTRPVSYFIRLEKNLWSLLLILDEVDCDLRYPDLRRKSRLRPKAFAMLMGPALASYCEGFQSFRSCWRALSYIHVGDEKAGYIRRKMRVYELIRGSSRGFEIVLEADRLRSFHYQRVTQFFK